MSSNFNTLKSHVVHRNDGQTRGFSSVGGFAAGLTSIRLEDRIGLGHFLRPTEENEDEDWLTTDLGLDDTNDDGNDDEGITADDDDDDDEDDDA